MQAIKEKINEVKERRKAKAEEQAEKELAKTRMDIAHEVRMAKEAEAEMDLHVAKACQLAHNHKESEKDPNPNTP